MWNFEQDAEHKEYTDSLMQSAVQGWWTISLNVDTMLYSSGLQIQNCMQDTIFCYLIPYSLVDFSVTCASSIIVHDGVSMHTHQTTWHHHKQTVMINYKNKTSISSQDITK
jgi:hypothetical protein